MMIFSRTVFRVSCAVVAWVVGIGYCVVLSVTPGVECGPSSNPFVASMAFALPLVPLLLLSTLALSYRNALRWVTAPFVLLVPLAVLGTWPFLDAAGVEAMVSCNATANSSWFDSMQPWLPYWAPLQLAVLTLLMVQVLRFWLRPPEGAAQ